MNISNQNNNQDYTLSSGSGNRKEVLNYNHSDYNNYQSWSNVNRGSIHLVAIDENNQAKKNIFRHNRIQPLAAPFMSMGDTSITWAPSNSEHLKPLEKYLKN